MIDVKKINDRIQVLNGDIQKVQQDLQTIEQRKAESTALLNALLGAKQQCESFLQELNNDEPEDNSDSGDVE
jgi:prefoldin subunit 5|tara:strand:- start:603 stop:818 length:216 start_codon:yes stop_codon:yes gene_type:complete